MDGVIFPFSPPFRLPYIDMDGGRQILGSLYTGKKLLLAKELPKIHQKTILLSNIEIFTFDNFYGPKKWRNYLYILYFNTISWTKKKQFRALTAENTPNLSNNPSKGDFTHPTNPTIRP